MGVAVDIVGIVGDDDPEEAGKAAVTGWVQETAERNGIPAAEIASVASAVATGATGVAIAVPFAALAVAAIKLTVKRLEKLWAMRAECQLMVADALADAAVMKGEYPIVPRSYAKTPDYAPCKIKVLGYVYEVKAGRQSWRACPFQCPVVRRVTYHSDAGFQHKRVDFMTGTWLTPWAFPYVYSNDGVLKPGWIVFGGAEAVAAMAMLAGWYRKALEQGLSDTDKDHAIASLLRIRRLTREAGHDPDTIGDDERVSVGGMFARGIHIKGAQRAIARVLLRSGVSKINEDGEPAKPPAAPRGPGQEQPTGPRGPARPGAGKVAAVKPDSDDSDEPKRKRQGRESAPVLGMPAKIAIGAAVVGGGYGALLWYRSRPRRVNRAPD